MGVEIKMEEEAHVAAARNYTETEKERKDPDCTAITHKI